MNHEVFNVVFSDPDEAKDQYYYGLLVGNFDQFTKEEAIKALEDPEASENIKSNARAFAEAYKLNVRQRIYAGRFDEAHAVCVDQNGRRTDLRAR